MNVGILSYGAYVPLYRIKTEEIAKVWGKEGSDIKKSLGVSEKSVASFDEDAVTLAYEAASAAFKNGKINPSEIEAVFVGSESHPYAVNPTSTIVGEFLGIGNQYLACDLEFACKAATTGMIVVSSMIEANKISRGLVIGTDTAQAKPHDVLEYTAGSGAAAFVLGKEKEGIIAMLIDFSSYSSDTPDFWRRDGARFPSHGGRFTGEPAYFAHIVGVTKSLLSKLKLIPSNFDYCVFHMPNGKFPREIAKRFGFHEKQLIPSLVIDYIGNPYSASSLLGFASVLDIAKPGQKIFIASYGSGAGSDAFVFEVTKEIKRQRNKVTVMDLINKKKHISYVEYLKYRRKI